jgi:hypothetical protein
VAKSGGAHLTPRSVWSALSTHTLHARSAVVRHTLGGATVREHRNRSLVESFGRLKHVLPNKQQPHQRLLVLPSNDPRSHR